MDRWSGKTAVVTGASSGIGAAVCVGLADAGLNVIGLARRPHLIEELKSQVKGGGSILARRCDVSKPEELSATFQWIDDTFGAVHIMINNAGVFHVGNITDISDQQISDEKIHSTIDTNTTATILCARSAVSSMKKHGFDGHVININSIAGHYVPFSPNFNIYSASKYAISAFSRALTNELAHLNSAIKVTTTAHQVEQLQYKSHLYYERSKGKLEVILLRLMCCRLYKQQQSISPGLVDTPMAIGVQDLPSLTPKDITDAVIYSLSTPPTVNISELTITPVGEKRL